jgi:hypothetical protein
MFNNSVLSCSELANSEDYSKSARDVHLKYIEQLPLSQIVKDYRYYVENDVWLIFKKVVEDYEVNAGSVKTIALLGSKRGNKSYVARVKRSILSLCSHVKAGVFDYEKYPYANVLSVTFTDDRSRSRHEQILSISKDFNRAKSYLRSKFGVLSAFIALECYDDGYLHAHCIFIFKEMYFSVFKHRALNFKSGKFEDVWRIREKDFIADAWIHGFVDVKAVYSVHGAINYLVKYLVKSLFYDKGASDDSKRIKTLAVLHAYKKRAFAVSGEFREALDSIRFGYP